MIAGVRTSEWTVAATPVDHPDAAAVLRAYYDDIVGRYYGRPATTAEVDTAMADEPSDDLVPPTGILLVARRGAEIAGCLGLRLATPALGELTRMYVLPGARGNAVGGRLILAVEAAARELGVAAIRMDTRADLVEARALYAKHGYREVEPFNDSRYADHWFEKQLH